MKKSLGYGFALALSLVGTKAYAQTSQICMTNSLIPYCAASTAYTLAANGTQTVSTNNAAFFLLNVTSGTVSISSTGNLGNVSNVSGTVMGNVSSAGSITQSFGVGQYYIATNGQNSYTVNSLAGANILVAMVNSAPSLSTTNLANINKYIENALNSAQGNQQSIASVNSLASNALSDITSEVNRATSAEQTLQTSISGNATNITNETNRALAAEDTLIPKKMIGAANGVPSLDANSAMNSPINTSQSETYQDVTNPDGVIVHLPLDKAIFDSSSMFTVGSESAQLGGLYDAAGNPSHRALSVIGQPYGNYNQGCTLCIFSTASGDAGGGGQAGISGIDYREGATAVNSSDYAAVGFYHFDENWDARITAQVASFAAGVATLTTAMTDEQMAQLHVGMYVDTNVVNPSDPNGDNGSFIQTYRFHGYIKSWDATHIYVYDWAVPGDGNTAGGQVPNVANLDTWLSTYTYPVVWIGTPAKNFAENEYMVADGSKVLGSAATTASNAFEREEFDWRGSNWTKAHSVSFHGWTTSFQCSSCDANAMDEGSYAYLVNGPALPTAYRAQLYGDGLEYAGYSTMLGSNGPPEVVNSDNSTTSTASNVPVGTNHVMAGFQSSLPSNNALQFTITSNKEQTTTGTWVDYGVRMGVSIDSARDRRAGLTGGSTEGQLAFDMAGDIGSICGLGYGSHISACFEGDGTFSVKNSSAFASGYTATFNGPVQSNGGIFNGSSVFTNGAVGYTASTSTSDATFSGQGNAYLWNAIDGGGARTESINVDPTNGAGGFAWYNVNSGDTLNSSSTPMLALTESVGAQFNVGITLNSGGSVGAGKNLYFNPTTVSNNLYPGLTACSSYTICTAGNIGANIGLEAGSFLGINNSNVSSLLPDGAGNWTVSQGTNSTTGAGTNAGGGIALAPYAYASLPATANLAVGMSYFCTDCYSPLRSSTYTKTGIEVKWNGSDWTDVVGNVAQH